MEGFSYVPVQMPPVKLPDNSVLEADFSVISENQQTLYEMITQAQLYQTQKLAVSMHTPEQGTHLGQLVTTIAAQMPNQIGEQTMQTQKVAVSMQSPEQGAHVGQVVTTIAPQVPQQSILVQDPQTMHSLQTDYQQISYY